ncbi:MAG: GGDEF and EAL domain-containing protein [Actinomycetota bacterium]
MVVRALEAAGDRDEPIHPRSGIVLLRIGLIATIALTSFVEPLEQRAALLATCATVVLLQPVIAHWAGTRRRAWQAFLLTDLLAATAIAAGEPALHMQYVVLTIALTSASAAWYRARGFLLFVALSVVGAVLVTLESGPDEAFRVGVAIAVASSSVGLAVLQMRLAAEQSRRDVGLSLEAAGGVAYTGWVDDEYVTFSHGAERLLGITPDEHGRVNFKELLHPDDVDEFWLPEEECVPGRTLERAGRFRTSSGDWRWLRGVVQVSERRGGRHLRGLMYDLTQEKTRLLKARLEATTDSLTGLSNRRALLRLLDEEVVVGRHLVLFDLNTFKRVNDTLGHHAGDELLRIVADRIGACIREQDLLVRLGGDEFALVISGFRDTPSARSLVDRILRSITEPMTLNGVQVSVSSSAGIVRETAELSGSTEMLRRADLAMYEAKRSSGRLSVFRSELETDHVRKAALVADLPRAIERNDLQLFFQPTLAADGSGVVGAEGLARWDHPDFGMLTPSDFLDVVLVSSQAGAFTQSMVRRALAVAKRLADGGRPQQIAVNVPVTTLEDSSFHTWFTEFCAITQVDPGLIVFELPESELRDGPDTQAAISRFAAAGVTMSIDDFGSGQTALDRLHWYDVRRLKLDSRLVERAEFDERESTILRNLISLAKELGYEVAAEGVETDGQLAQLRRFGVDEVQGYLFAPALDEEDFVAFVTGRRDADRDALTDAPV